MLMKTIVGLLLAIGLALYPVAPSTFVQGSDNRRIIEDAPIITPQTVITYPDWVFPAASFTTYHYNDVYNLTQSDVVLRYTLDTTNLSLPPSSWSYWQQIGIRASGAGSDFNPPIGSGCWMSYGAKDTVPTPGAQNSQDKFNLQYQGGRDERYYDSYSPITVNSQVGTPTAWNNYGLWFDRDTVDPWQDDMWGCLDGWTYNTGGIYNVEIAYHAISPTQGTAFATVNGVPVGFYTAWSANGPNHSYNIGMSFTGNMTQMQIFGGCWSGTGSGQSVARNIQVITDQSVCGPGTQPAGNRYYYYDQGGDRGTINMSDGQIYVATLRDIDMSMSGNAMPPQTSIKKFRMLIEDWGLGSGNEQIPLQMYWNINHPNPPNIFWSPGMSAPRLESIDETNTVQRTMDFAPGTMGSGATSANTPSQVPGTFDVRLVMGQIESGPDIGRWNVIPYYRLPSGGWTPFPGGVWMTPTAFDLTQARLTLQINSDSDGWTIFTPPTVNAIDPFESYVDDDWVGLPYMAEVNFPCDLGNIHYIGVDAFPSINQAYSAAIPGANINVAPGDYQETVAINQAKDDITIKGVCWTDPGLLPISVTRPHISGPNGSLIFANSAQINNNRFEDLIITNGIQFVNYAPINGVSFDFVYFMGTFPGQVPIFAMNQPPTGIVSNFYMENCAIDGENNINRAGIGGNRFAGDFTILSTEFTRILNWGAVMDIDIASDYSPYGGNGFPLDVVTFSDNYIHHCNGSVSLRGHYIQKTTQVFASNNRWETIGGNQGLQGEQWAALEVNHASYARIDNNFVNGVVLGMWGEGQAFQLWDIAILDCFRNTIINNYQGIWIFGGEAQGSYGGPWPIPGGSIHHNIICGNQEYGLSVDPNCTGANPLLAENNWWGANDGPEKDGHGDEVIGQADFNPWLVLKAFALPARILIGGSASTVTGDMRINSNDVDTSAQGFLPDNQILVNFKTNFGNLNGSGVNASAYVIGGVATVILRSSNVEQIATVCASAECKSDYSEACVKVEFYGRVEFKITKNAGKSVYGEKDKFTYTIFVHNVGSGDAVDVILTDVFPRELEFVSSRPSATASNTSVRFSVGSLRVGGAFTATLTFKLSEKIEVPENGLTLTNLATVQGKHHTSGQQDSKTDYASIFIPRQQSVEVLQFEVNWKGIDLKTGNARLGNEVELRVRAKGGSSPYRLTCSFGDNSADQSADLKNSDSEAVFKHAFSQAGDYNVIITCTDTYGTTKRVERIIHLK